LSEERVERRLAAILAADVAGYSRLMGLDEAGTLARLRTHRRELIDPKITEHKGRIVKTTGDGILIEFPSVVEAVACAVAVQNACSAPYFRPYTNTDVIGCELGGAVKNVIALANGVAAGLGFGENAQASLITRGLAETARVAAAEGATLDPAATIAELDSMPVFAASAPISSMTASIWAPCREF